MPNQKLVLARLQKQEKQLQKQPIPNILVKRKGVLDFHFCIYGMQGAYSGGYYHGVLSLSEDYPFAPPKLKFLTPSGRFDVDKSICTTFTDFHKQSWSSAWNIRTMLLGTQSFMLSEQGGYGSMKSSSSSKSLYASQSLKNNMKNPQFVELFKDEIIKSGLQKNLDSFKQEKEQNSNKLISNQSGSYFLYFILIFVIVLWFSKSYWIGPQL